MSLVFKGLRAFRTAGLAIPSNASMRGVGTKMGTVFGRESVHGVLSPPAQFRLGDRVLFPIGQAPQVPKTVRMRVPVAPMDRNDDLGL